MKKVLIGLTLLLAGGIASAQPYTGTRAATSGGITLLQSNDGTWLHLYGNGVPALTTFLGESVPNNTIYTNTGSGTNYYYSAGTWTGASGSATAITPGVTTATGCTSKLLIADASSLVNCNAAFVADASGAGNGVITLAKTMSGGAGTSNFFNVTGTLPTVNTAGANGALLVITSAGSSAQTQAGVQTQLAAGYTGSSNTLGNTTTNFAAGTGAWSSGFTAGTGNIGLYGSSVATTTGSNFGVIGFGSAGDISVGVYGSAPTSKNSGTNIGVIGIAVNGGTTPVRVGGYFGLNSTIPTFAEAALIADNGAIAAPIALFRDNGTTKIIFDDGGLAEFSGQTNISGPDSTTNVEIGSTGNDANGGTGGTSVVIGNAATNSGNATGVVVIGSGATQSGSGGGIGTDTVTIGRGSTTSGGVNTVTIGAGNSTAQNNNVLIGSGLTATANGGVVLLGRGITSSANFQAIFADTTNGYNDIYFGKGVTSTTALAYTIHGTGGSGADNAGGNLLLAGGQPTGTGRGGDTILQTSPSASGTGSTAQASVDRMRIVGKAVALTDAATTIFTITGLGAHIRSGGSFDFCVQASDGTNDQVACGRTYWGAVDTTAGAGGETCTNLVDGLTISAAASGAASSGTLVVTADATTGTDLCNIRITPAGSLTETTYNVYYTVEKQLPGGTINPQ